MEKQKKLHYDLDGSPVEITVQRANVRVGVNRYHMMMLADEENKKEGSDALVAPIRLFTFPSIVCGTLEVTGLPWPMEFDEFLELDEALVDAWVSAVHEVNPQWRGTTEGTEEVKKKK